MNDEYPDVEVLPPSDPDNDYLGVCGPLTVLEDLMLTAESEQVRVNAAGKLAEYRHMKMAPNDVDAKTINFNVELTAPAKPMGLPTKK